jgi:hypothetical protein
MYACMLVCIHMYKLRMHKFTYACILYVHVQFGRGYGPVAGQTNTWTWKSRDTENVTKLVMLMVNQ